MARTSLHADWLPGEQSSQPSPRALAGTILLLVVLRDWQGFDYKRVAGSEGTGYFKHWVKKPPAPPSRPATPPPSLQDMGLLQDPGRPCPRTRRRGCNKNVGTDPQKQGSFKQLLIVHENTLPRPCCRCQPKLRCQICSTRDTSKVRFLPPSLAGEAAKARALGHLVA